MQAVPSVSFVPQARARSRGCRVRARSRTKHAPHIPSIVSCDVRLFLMHAKGHVSAVANAPGCGDRPHLPRRAPQTRVPQWYGTQTARLRWVGRPGGLLGGRRRKGCTVRGNRMLGSTAPGPRALPQPACLGTVRLSAGHVPIAAGASAATIPLFDLFHDAVVAQQEQPAPRRRVVNPQEVPGCSAG